MLTISKAELRSRLAIRAELLSSSAWAIIDCNCNEMLVVLLCFLNPFKSKSFSNFNIAGGLNFKWKKTQLKCGYFGQGTVVLWSISSWIWWGGWGFISRRRRVPSSGPIDSIFSTPGPIDFHHLLVCCLWAYNCSLLLWNYISACKTFIEKGLMLNGLS